MRKCRGFTAEQPAIERSPTAGEKLGISGRKRSSLPCFPPAAAPEARRFRLSSLLFGKEVYPSQSLNGEGKWRGLRSSDRRPLCRATATIACDRSGSPAQRSPAVFRRPGSRHALNPRGLSASICVICGFSVSGGRLCDFFVSSCLCVCDVRWLCVRALCLCASVVQHGVCWVSGNHGSQPRLRRALPRSGEP